MSSSAAASEIPSDCGHKDYTINCERCFVEMTAIINGQVKSDTHAAHMEGAILCLWHLVVVIMDMEDQLRPMTASMDLRHNDVARDVIANLRQLSTYFMQLGGDPVKLQGALSQGAMLVAETQRAAAAKSAAPRIIL